MMHFVPKAREPVSDAGKTANSDQLILRARVELLSAEVSAARDAANESLDRLNALAQPNVGGGSFLMSLFDLHNRDKEALFEAMRRLEAARDQLRRISG